MFYLTAVDTPEDEAFVTRLYTEYEQMMFKIAFNILKDRYDAEDSVHEAFLNIIRNDGLNKLKSLQWTEIKAYLIITVKNSALKCYNSRRANTGENIEDMHSLSGGDSAEDRLFVEYESEKLQKALRRLSPSDYELLYQSAVMSYSISDIAKRLGITENTVRQRFFRARQRLRKLLNEEETANDRR